MHGHSQRKRTMRLLYFLKYHTQVIGIDRNIFFNRHAKILAQKAIFQNFLFKKKLIYKLHIRLDIPGS